MFFSIRACAAEGESNDEVIMQNLTAQFETKVKELQEQKKDQIPVPLIDVLPTKGRGSIIRVTEVSPDKSKAGAKSSRAGGRGRRQSFAPEALSSPGKSIFLPI